MSNIDSLGSFDIKVDRSAMPREDNLHTVDINVPASNFDIELHPAPHDDGGLMEEVERVIRSKFHVRDAFLYRTFASQHLYVLSLTTKHWDHFSSRFEIFVSGHDCMDSEDEDPLYEDDEDTGVSEVLIRVHRHGCTALCKFLEVDPRLRFQVSPMLRSSSVIVHNGGTPTLRIIWKIFQTKWGNLFSAIVIHRGWPPYLVVCTKMMTSNSLKVLWLVL